MKLNEKKDYIKCKHCGEPLNTIIYGLLSNSKEVPKHSISGGCEIRPYAYKCSNRACGKTYKKSNVFRTIYIPFIGKRTLGLKKGFEYGSDEEYEKIVKERRNKETEIFEKIAAEILTLEEGTEFVFNDYFEKYGVTKEDKVHYYYEVFDRVSDEIYTSINASYTGKYIRFNNKKATKDAYNGIANKYYNLYKNDESDFKYFDMFLKECGPKIIDLGCGMGHYSKYMHSKGFEVTGVDFSEGMIDIAKKNNPDIDFVVSDIFDLKTLGDKKFDGVVLAYVLQHVSKLDSFKLFDLINKFTSSKSKLLMFFREGNNESEKVSEPIDGKYQYMIDSYSKKYIENTLKGKGWNVTFIESKEVVDDPNSLAPTTVVVLAEKI